MDLRRIAEQLIVQLFAESDKMKERAEGVRMFLGAIIAEYEAQNGTDGQQDSESGLPKKEEQQAQ